MFQNQPKNRQKGTGFTNIGRIVGANVGAGQQMAGKVAQGIQTAGQNVQNQLGQAQQKFNTGFQQTTQPVLGTLQQGSAMAKRSDESDEDYAKRTKEANVDYAEIGKKVQEAKYTGPKGLEDSQRMLGSAVGAGQLGTMTTSGQGQQELLKQFVAGKTGYTKGQGAMDQMLLGQSAEGQRQLQQAREAVSTLPEDVLSSAKLAQARAQAMDTGIDKEKARVLGGVQSSVNEMEQRAKERGQMYSKEAGRLAELLANPQSQGYVKGERGTEYNEQQAALDRQLLKNMGKFGIGAGQSKLDTSDPQAAARALQEIASGATTGVNARYGDVQRQALQKLSQFQQDEAKGAKIASEKDKAAFAVGDKDVENLASMKEQRAQAEQEKSNIQDIPQLENVVNARGRVSHLDYMSMAEGILGRDVVQSVRQRMDDENGRTDWFGASDEYIDSVTDGAIQDLIRQKLAPKYQSRDRLALREQNTMSLQDYINKMYGLS
jgi:hypothetical protein